ncbi:carbohydrate ABC transporter permease [Kribbella sp. VKM Ac-2566]|uniref:carbohydrate ABC transporter permease n=1 Tax=Kribbella sp. VKM Ac-2566 TaxID=2512218 RepID=UPI001062E719|nr:sugar ABC transporter permease [Kribbella sp. VKM Ac-2566]TDX03564.1 carbohydrate ABC transporter membrane protein 1 (CUT1 family) [Kribbella sp. VKM Ac-2566]
MSTATRTTKAPPAAEHRSPVRPGRQERLGRTEARWGLLLAAPAILGFLIFTIGPMIASAVFSLTDWRIGGPARFIGLGNYDRLAHDHLFWKSLNVTTYYTLGVVPLTLLVGFVIAILVNQGIRGRSLWRTIYYLPTLVPAVASSVLWIWIFNPDFGLLNSMLRQAGLPESSWIYGEKSAVPSLILMSVWGFGNAMVIFLAGLQGVPQQLYEAVAIDGGGTWARFRHVTLPFMTPVIFYNLVTGVIGTFQVFNQAYIMTQGGPNNATEFYIYYLYTKAFTDSEIGYASALAWVLFVIVLVITVLLFRNARRWVYYEMGAAR